jgi:hypothetical protein
MPVALTTALDPPAPLIPPRKRWTRAECAVLEASGIWDQQKLELIDGELITKMGKPRSHINALVSMMHWLADVFGQERLNPNAPIDVAPEDNPSNEPEPDLIVHVPVRGVPVRLAAAIRFSAGRRDCRHYAALRPDREGSAVRTRGHCRVLGAGFERAPLDRPPRT